MIIAIKENEFNPSFVACYGEEKAIEQGYTLIEVDDKYCDCAIEDFDENVFNINKYNARKRIPLIKEQISQLKIKLADSDYKILKYLEGELSQEEYDEIVAKRKEWRKEINELEEQLKEDK